MFRLAHHNLFQNKIRLVIAVGGVALALMLVLSLDAIFAGVERRLTAYIRNSGADIFVAQSGVRNMHMAASSLPAAVADKVAMQPGVRSVTPILYLANMIVVGEERNLAYVIGLPKNAQAGTPWRVAQGVRIPGRKQAVIDRSVAAALGVGLGDKVKILGRELTVAGLSEETASLTNSIAFISSADFAELRGGSDRVSFVLVKLEPGQSAAAVARRIEDRVGDVSALPTTSFAEREVAVVRDMSTDVVAIMNLVGFMIGLAVMALTVYVATLSRRGEYGVLKALGARNRHLYTVVLIQTLESLTLGFLLAWALTLLLSQVAPRLNAALYLELTAASLLKIAGLSLVIGSLAAALPIRELAKLDPAVVFRRA